MNACKLLVACLALAALVVSCGTDTGQQSGEAFSYVPTTATVAVAIDVGRILSEKSIQEFLKEPMAEVNEKLDTSLLSPHDIGEVVAFTTDDPATLGMMGPPRMAFVVSFNKPMPLSVLDSLVDFPLDERTAADGRTYLANDAEELYISSPAENIWFASPNELVVAHMSAGEISETEEMSEESAAPLLMKEMTSEPGWLLALSFDVSRSERPDIGPLAEMLAHDTTNPELAQMAAFAPAIQQAIGTINSAGFSIGRRPDNFAISVQMRFADPETTEEIRKAIIMMLGLAGGEATEKELGFVKEIIDRVDVRASEQTVAISVTISDSDIAEAKTALEGI